MNDVDYPDWDKPVTHGDLMTALAYTRAMGIRLVGLVQANGSGDREKIKKAFEDYFAEDEKAAEFAERLGGERGHSADG